MINLLNTSTVGLFFASFGISLLKAVILFVIGYVVITLLLKLVSKLLAKSRIEKSARKFLYTFTKYVLYLLLIMIIVSALGISITGLVAILSAAGLAISLALQGSLSNLANGIVIIITKPFKEGDFVTISGFSGSIKEIKLTHTIITSTENKLISIPNKIVIENVIINNSVLETKKVSYSFLVGYTSDVQQVKDIILNSFAKTDMVLTEPKPYAAVDALETNGVRFVASCYCESKYYTEVYHPVLEEIFNEFKKQKIVLPNAQIEVKMKEDKQNLPFNNKTTLKQKPVHTEPVYEKPAEELEPKPQQAQPEKQQDVDYLDFVDEIEVVEEDQTTTQPEFEVVEETEDNESSEKENLATKLKKKFQPKDKKPPVIIKKK